MKAFINGGFTAFEKKDKMKPANATGGLNLNV
jgi:hypothetical protein